MACCPSAVSQIPLTSLAHDPPWTGSSLKVLVCKQSVPSALSRVTTLNSLHPGSTLGGGHTADKDRASQEEGEHAHLVQGRMSCCMDRASCSDWQQSLEHEAHGLLGDAGELC